VAGVGDERLLAGNHVALAAALETGTDARHVRARAGLGAGEAEERRSGAELGEPALLLRLAAEQLDRADAEVVDHDRGADAGAPGAELLGDQARGEQPLAGPAVAFGHVAREQPGRVRLADDLGGKFR